MKSKALAPLIILPLIAACAVWVTALASSGPSDKYATYRNDRWHFSLVVPAGTRVDAHDDPDNGQTMQFIDASGNLEFEVGTTPYTQLDVALGEEGAPSNTFDQPSGGLGVVNVFHGDVFKVWFVHDGTFYVVSALPKDQEKLLDVLKSWQFE